MLVLSSHFTFWSCAHQIHTNTQHTRARTRTHTHTLAIVFSPLEFEYKLATRGLRATKQAYDQDKGAAATRACKVIREGRESATRRIWGWRGGVNLCGGGAFPVDPGMPSDNVRWTSAVRTWPIIVAVFTPSDPMSTFVLQTPEFQPRLSVVFVQVATPRQLEMATTLITKVACRRGRELEDPVADATGLGGLALLRPSLHSLAREGNDLDRSDGGGRLLIMPRKIYNFYIVVRVNKTFS